MPNAVRPWFFSSLLFVGLCLAPRAAWSQNAAPAGPLGGYPGPRPGSPAYHVLGAVVLGTDFGSATWLATGAVSSRDLKSAMVQPVPIGLALGATAAGAAVGALATTDSRRLLRLGIPVAGGVMLGSMVALFGGGAWYLTCNEPQGPDRDACQRRAGRFFAGSLAIGTFLGGATGLTLALTVPPRSASQPQGVSVFAGPGSLLVKF